MGNLNNTGRLMQGTATSNGNASAAPSTSNNNCSLLSTSSNSHADEQVQCGRVGPTINYIQLAFSMRSSSKTEPHFCLCLELWVANFDSMPSFSNVVCTAFVTVKNLGSTKILILIFRRTYNRLTRITLTMTATPFSMDAVTVTCYDTKNRDQRPNEDLFYQFYPNYPPFYLNSYFYESIKICYPEVTIEEEVWLVGLAL